MQIGRRDVAWNFAATFMRVASGLIVLPLVLRMLPQDDIGLWYVFVSVGSIATLLDFGFSNSFSRNITYIFSGVKELLAEGHVVVDKNQAVDYSLLKSVIKLMRLFYAAVALLFLFLFVLISFFYLPHILLDYTGNTDTIKMSWYVYGLFIAYQLYTYYYSSLLIGRGYIKQSQQAIVLGLGARIAISASCLLAGLGIFSLVIAQFIGDILTRSLAHFFFFDKELRSNLKYAQKQSVTRLMRIIAPNSIRIGLTSLGGFFVTKSSLFIAPLFLPLAAIASFGITKQLVDLIASIGTLWYSTFNPKITEYRVTGDAAGVKRLYIKSQLWLIFVFSVCGVGLLLCGEWLLELINSKTQLLSQASVALLILVSFLDVHCSLSMSLLLTKNEVPYVKSLLLTGLATVLLLIFFLDQTSLGVLSLILAPGIAQLFYQNWKWPITVWKEMDMKIADYRNVISWKINSYT